MTKRTVFRLIAVHGITHARELRNSVAFTVRLPVDPVAVRASSTTSARRMRFACPALSCSLYTAQEGLRVQVHAAADHLGWRSPAEGQPRDPHIRAESR